MAVLDVRWMSLFADVPDTAVERGLVFWERITDAAAGEPTGDRWEFVPLTPASGDPVVWVQRIDDGEPGWHLDLHVPDVAAAVRVAQAAGAQCERTSDSLATLRSPAGQPFCLVEETRATRRLSPAPTWPGGRRSLADQVCFDIPAAEFDREFRFWSELTGWSPGDADLDEFGRLQVPDRLPLRVLLQRLGTDDDGPARAHLDLSADDARVEVVRHESHGASVVREAQGWTTLRDPAGLIYCVTRRRPRAAAA